MLPTLTGCFFKKSFHINNIMLDVEPNNLFTFYEFCSSLTIFTQNTKIIKMIER